MEYDELVRLLNAHEWKEVEFKEARTAVPKNAYETVSAFANTAGGHLVFGVKKGGADFEIVGVLDVDKVQNELLSTLRSTDKISLIIDVEEHLHKSGEDDLLIFYIPEAARTEKPVFLNGDIRRSFIRKGGADVKCSRDELQRLLNDAPADRYDGQTVDIDLESCFDASTISWYRGVYESKPGSRSYADKTNVEFLQDYADHSRKPEVRKFTDRTIFYNPGDAFDTRMDLLQPGEREVRNPRIVTAFRRIGLSEHAGWGLKDVFENWRQLGNDDPVILNDKTRKTFTITLIDRSAAKNTAKTRQSADSINTPQVQRLLHGLQGEMSRTEIMALLELKDRMYFSRDYLKPALDAGLIEMTIPDKPNSSRQKYRTTASGRAFLPKSE